MAGVQRRIDQNSNQEKWNMDTAEAIAHHGDENDTKEKRSVATIVDRPKRASPPLHRPSAKGKHDRDHAADKLKIDSWELA
mmetsp:Transcript_66861/g.207073  ORF Transcript_66861/g.207073 Transcript_66861/m.207073 type:complete len:81 (-) Transcript_66861:2147-2389(-)